MSELQTLIKVYIKKGEFVVDVCKSYKRTPNTIKDAIFHDIVYRDDYFSQQIRIKELGKVKSFLDNCPNTAYVFCYESEIEAAKASIVEYINKHTDAMIRDMEIKFRYLCEDTAKIKGVKHPVISISYKDE
ncbi:hypothetical protein DEEACLCL_00103 [Salmonella phage CRW-SP2]|nr:hypothetical protein DEEACLCL_00103 [Salmonella phage CRW-SP2]